MLLLNFGMIFVLIRGISSFCYPYRTYLWFPYYWWEGSGGNVYCQSNGTSCKNSLESLSYSKCLNNGSNCEIVFTYNHTSGFGEGFGPLAGRVTGTYLGGDEYAIRIHVPRISDEGRYICSSVVDSVEYTSWQNEAAVQVWARPWPMYLAPTRSYIVANIPVPFICDIQRTYPTFGSYFIPEGINTTFTSARNEDDSFNVQIRSTFVFEQMSGVTCVCTPHNTPSSTAAFRVDKVWPQPAIEYPTRPIFLAPSIQDKLELQCTISGTNISDIKWYMGQNDLSIDHFEEPQNRVVNGSFAHNQSQAITSQAVWKPPRENASCTELDEYSGLYKCIATLEEYDDYSFISPDIVVIVQYAPKSVFVDDLHFKALINSTRVLYCSVCASPAVNSYIWTFDGLQLRSGITGGDSQYIVIHRVTEGDFGIYTCEATNKHGKAYLSIFLAEEEKEPAPTPDQPMISYDFPTWTIAIITVLSLVIAAITVVGVAYIIKIKRNKPTSSEHENIEFENCKDQPDNITVASASTITSNTRCYTQLTGSHEYAGVYDSLDFATD